MKLKTLPKAIAVVGPTAAGKTKIGVQLAAEFNGEIVSADSRQVYKYLDICTGKDKDEYIVMSKSQSPISNEIPSSKFQKFTHPAPSGHPSQEGIILPLRREARPDNPVGRGARVIEGGGVKGKEKINIPYHLIDILDPSQKITVADFQKKAFEAINGILQRKKLPILVGGSPFYVYSVTEGWQFPKIKQDQKLREKLGKLPLAKLQEKLKKLDPEAYENIDTDNPRRLIRAVEICTLSGQKFAKSRPKTKPRYNFLLLGIKFPNEVLRQRIQMRLKERLSQGMIEEVKNILARKQAKHADLERMGLEPRYIARYLQNQINHQELEEQLEKEIYHFAKRQMTWFRKDKRIIWVADADEATKLTKKFLSFN